VTARFERTTADGSPLAGSLQLNAQSIGPDGWHLWPRLGRTPDEAGAADPDRAPMVIEVATDPERRLAGYRLASRIQRAAGDVDLVASWDCDP
jgi:hypothetical protein